jgi:hypothetical protein
MNYAHNKFHKTTFKHKSMYTISDLFNRKYFDGFEYKTEFIITLHYQNEGPLGHAMLTNST